MSHRFVAAADGSLSRYGWVREVPLFTTDDFVREHMSAAALSEIERNHIEVMLRAAAKLAIDTPVAAAYHGRGLGNPEMVLVVHRVIFYGGPRE